MKSRYEKIDNIIEYIILITLGIAFLVGFIVCIYLYIDKEEDIVINYNENNDINYKVYLKENNFFDTPYLEEGVTYISTLIDHIDIDYSFSSTYSNFIDGNYSYYIKATIMANEPNSNGVYWSKEYMLKEEIPFVIKNSNSIEVNDSISVDYQYYNNLLLDFKKQFNLTMDGTLKIELIVNSDVSNEVFKDDMKVNSSMSLEIPLTQKTVDLSINADNSNKNKEFISHSVRKNRLLIIVISIVLIDLFIYVVWNLIGNYLRNSNIYSKYAKELKKILNTYDSIITNANSIDFLDKYNVIKVNTFEELLDAHREVRTPINFYEDKFEGIAKFILIKNDIAWIYELVDEKKYKSDDNGKI